MKVVLIVETRIEIEADSASEAMDIFYDGVYEVDRHGNVRVEGENPNRVDL